MTAIATTTEAARQIKALVSVTGAIAGTRLADLGSTIGIVGCRSALRRSGIRCDIEDHGGIAGLRREVRYRALRAWSRRRCCAPIRSRRSAP
jgi:hypothetical protein